MQNQIKSALFACAKHVQKSVQKCTHGVFRIRTDIAYVGLGLINCVLISLAFILLQSILFVGYCYILTSVITIIRMSKPGAAVNLALLLNMLENTAHT